MKYYSFISFLLFIFPSFLHSQDMLAQYRVSKNVEVTKQNGQKVKLAMLDYTAFVYKKGNRYFSYNQPLYLSKYPEGYIDYTDENGTTSVTITIDSAQDKFITDLDSLKFKWMSNQSSSITPAGKPHTGRYSGSDPWRILPDTTTISGLKCQKAELYRWYGNKEKLYTIWFCAGVPVAGGPSGIAFVPGLVVEATDYVTDETYQLTSYAMNAGVPENFKKIPFFANEL